MQITALFRDDDAQSEVIGVILMVAIVVILAAVIGTFVLGIGQQTQADTPQVVFSFDFDETDGTNDCTPLGNEGGLTITHESGDVLLASQLTVTDGTSSYDVADCSDVPSDVTAGTSWTEQVDSDDTVRVTWESKNGKTTATVGRWTGPDA